MIIEKELISELLRVSKVRIPDLLLFKRETGVERMGASKKLPVRRVGTPGQSDLWGIWTGAIHIEIEIKSSKARLLPSQLTWKTFCLSNGIPHLVLQAIPNESIEDEVERWCKRIESTRPKNGVVTLQIGQRMPPPVPEPDRIKVTWLPTARADLRNKT